MCAIGQSPGGQVTTAAAGKQRISWDLIDQIYYGGRVKKHLISWRAAWGFFIRMDHSIQNRCFGVQAMFGYLGPLQSIHLLVLWFSRASISTVVGGLSRRRETNEIQHRDRRTHNIITLPRLFDANASRSHLSLVLPRPWMDPRYLTEPQQELKEN